ncbi:MAG: GIY-YIG nuclease family protein [Lachnospiraceae bacterium]|nr:GIY-YIG nuclease family protein [Lachnospiraceae bacterium]
MRYYTYIVRCADDTFYTGYTTDVEKRIDMHNASKGAKYTRGRLPVSLVYFEEHENKHDALSREWHIKRMTRSQKEELIEDFKENKV